MKEKERKILQLTALRELAKKHLNLLDEITDIARELTGDEDASYTDDYINCGGNPEKVLELIKADKQLAIGKE